MSGKLTTHVLDLTTGRPAEGVTIVLTDRVSGETLKTVTTNRDGRTDAPLLATGEMRTGDFELLFFVGDYFGSARFLDQVPIHFRITEPGAAYHVPLLCTPWAYSTYRGS